MKPLDITDDKYGNLTAIKRVRKTQWGMSIWLCLCDCGNEIEVNINNLRNGHTRSCGCIQKEVMQKIGLRKRHNLLNHKFHRLLVIAPALGIYDKPRWLCRCDCGKELIVRAASLKNGQTKSCGCLATDNAKEQSRLRFRDITGETFGRLKVLEFVKRNNSQSLFLCQCSCGNEIITASHSLLRGNTKSCGCYQSDWASEYFSKRIGETNPSWNPNLSDEERRRARKGTWQWRNSCLKRDQYICQATGATDNLIVHHLDGYDWCPEKRTDTFNGITISKDFHDLFHFVYGYKLCTSEQFYEFLEIYNPVIRSQCQARQGGK